jgi:hypothetical protein
LFIHGSPPWDQNGFVASFFHLTAIEIVQPAMWFTALRLVALALVVDPVALNFKS